MGGTVCIIIIRGNKTQANARSLSTSEIIDVMTQDQNLYASALLDGIAADLSKISGTKLHLDPTAAGEAAILVSAQFAIAAAQSVCDLAYEFLTKTEQELATSLMQTFNDNSDALLAQIAANP